MHNARTARGHGREGGGQRRPVVLARLEVGHEDTSRISQLGAGDAAVMNSPGTSALTAQNGVSGPVTCRPWASCGLRHTPSSVGGR